MNMIPRVSIWILRYFCSLRARSSAYFESAQAASCNSIVAGNQNQEAREQREEFALMKTSISRENTKQLKVRLN